MLRYNLINLITHISVRCTAIILSSDAFYILTMLISKNIHHFIPPSLTSFHFNINIESGSFKLMRVDLLLTGRVHFLVSLLQ